ncbi:unnamed protein product [Pleuronectes platessa]|uniref:Uncharacterized protein n=1 Tax=Pleuronectes platessa TaxID=8262 RepID=A0A9N7TX87_PLEPL|nr:unnamed protein product [Pleuronectes platessa]
MYNNKSGVLSFCACAVSAAAVARQQQSTEAPGRSLRSTDRTTLNLHKMKFPHSYTHEDMVVRGCPMLH